MKNEEETENKGDESEDAAPEKPGFIGRIMASVDSRYPKLAQRLRDMRVQVLLLFIILLIFYLNLIIWDFYFSSDSVPYGNIMKGWFEEGEIDSYELLRPAHPLTMPLAIAFTYLMIPLIGHNYLLSYAVLNAILGAATVAIFYWVCQQFARSWKFSLLCALGLAFSFAFWENCEMAEDKSLGFFLFAITVPVLFAFAGEIKPFSWFENLPVWQKGLVTGIFMGLVLAAHVSFVLFFLFSLFLLWRYKGFKFFIGKGFICYILGSAFVCGIVFGIVAVALEAEGIGGFIGMFTEYHTGEGAQQYFALAEPEEFSLTTQVRGTAGGVFTTLFMFISSEPAYYSAIIVTGFVVLLIMAYVIISARKNKVASSFFVLYVIWFANYFFFAPDDRNAWVYLLVPVWLSICIGLDMMEKEGIRLILFRREMPDKMKSAVTPIAAVVVAILLANNVVVFADAHLNHDDREEFVNFADDNIPEDDAIIIGDESLVGFFNYYSDRSAVHYGGVVTNPAVSDEINASFLSGTPVYLAEFWLLDSYVVKGSPRTEKTYEARLELHRQYVERFESMYNHTLAYRHEWSDIHIITGLK
ncbi:MAG: hypothetical protein JSW28_01895 [Thermoplasmata archaeon]|nr:MAG: hypothetical protein JSW28_01895 [Thermoplasmata archaeon]